MSGDVGIEILGIDEIIATVSRAAEASVYMPAMEQATQLLRTQLAIYPPPPRGQRYPFKSEKQRRYVMALVRAGEVPYRRTGTLGRRWTTAISTQGTTLRGVVGNNTVYGPFVQGQESQAQFHSGRWRTDERVATTYADDILRIFERITNNVLR